MSSKKKFFLIFVFILFDIFLLIGFLMIRDAAMLNSLKKEVASLSKLDVTKDRYNTKIKTKGGYGIVEKSIKSYLDQYAVLLQDTLLIVKDPSLIGILSYDNYVQDGPDFQKSLAYLEKSQSTFNSNIDTLLLDLEKDTIQNYIYQKTDEEYYCNLYMELMLSDSFKADFLETKELLNRTKTSINNVFDVSKKVLNFLVSNKEDWVLEDGEIKFRTNDLYNQYMSFLAEL